MKNALIGYTGFIGSNLFNFKKNLSKFNSYNSLYSWEYLYKDNINFKPEQRNNEIIS